MNFDLEISGVDSSNFLTVMIILPNLLSFQNRKRLKWPNFQTAVAMATVMAEEFEATFQLFS